MKRDYLARQGLHHPELAQAIAGRSQTEPAFLITAYEKPFLSAKYFGNRMKKRCQEADLMNCAVHGLWHLAATRLCEVTSASIA